MAHLEQSERVLFYIFPWLGETEAPSLAAALKRG